MKPPFKNRKILYVYNQKTSFTISDRDLLQVHWDVLEWYQPHRTVNLPALVAAVRHCDLVFGWFASWHTFWPITLAWMLRKPSILVIGGYDVANLPEIEYGLQRGGVKKWLSRWAIHHATALTTFSVYSQKESERNLGLPSARINMIYLAIADPFASQEMPPKPRDPLALTVGEIKQNNLSRKGHEDFVRAAALLPEITFALVGKWQDSAIASLRAIATDNVQFPGYVSAAALHDYYQRASVYVQPSRHEGFGMSVAEAMLGGCIPVVTRVGSLPEVVGDTGVYVEANTPEQIASAVRQALTWGVDARRRARARILTQFPLECRRQALYHLVEQLLTSPESRPYGSR